MGNGRSMTKRKQGNVRKECLIDPTYSERPSLQRHGSRLRPELQGAVYGTCDVERRAFRGGARLWRRPMMLG